MAYTILVERYYKNCWGISQEYYERYSRSGLFPDDFFSIAVDCLLKAIDNYDNDKGSFFSYWIICTKNAFARFIKENYANISFRSMNSISIDYSFEDGGSLHDLMGEEDHYFEQNMLHESIKKIILSEKYGLKEIEKKILLYYLEGYKPREIAKILNTNPSVIYRRFTHAVKKIRNVIDFQNNVIVK